MEQRRVYGENHWYHETQATHSATEVPPPDETARIAERFLLDLALPSRTEQAHASWLTVAQRLTERFLPAVPATDRIKTFSAYDRLSTALTAAQTCGIQRLCSHYAARLAPLPGPDSSKESNQRLAQITQHARQLAGSPWIITERSRTQLAEVGLTRDDITLINQIIGFVGFQARVIAIFQAALRQPSHGLPGMTQQEEALSIDFTSPYPVQPLLAEQPPFNQLRIDPGPFAVPVALMTARINGCVGCFNAWASRWQGADRFIHTLRHSAQGWDERHPVPWAVVHAVQLLTRAPERFAAAQLTSLIQCGFSQSSAVRLLAWCGLCGWMNRLNITQTRR